MNGDYRGFSAERIDTSTSVAHPARVYAYLLGYSDWYEADEKVGAPIMKDHPEARRSAWAARHFMQRSTYYLAQLGIRQFLDIGCGFPMSPNLHQIARHASPDARIVCVDNDPVVIRRFEAELKGSPQDRTALVYADFTNPGSILKAPELTATLDLGEPVALCLNSMLCFVADDDQPYDRVAELVDALCPGSYVSLSHPTGDFRDMGKVVTSYNTPCGTGPLVLRSHAEILRFFTGLEVIDPGLTVCHQWRPDVVVPDIGDGSGPKVDSSGIGALVDSKYAGIARKP
ncbi:methyltransferase [Streptomyces lunaelactis]|uniref:Methyltransferase n=1 Tax=Streptomyces lunaelactis TaxID=1535768 RepID=A0A2R4SVT5_9ACTN|nr:SAM-dependent methyltransferase [Streptomyces lunaelactis]AVZ70964.1 methyltransferase [Streptomyces lunaelactis]NUK27793.1 SAM-dependent methyltransferase [Streptomyces lunaelactis]NUK88336.1 SAM-dependent methyltransferase [Streptomyces lunaelactis]